VDYLKEISPFLKVTVFVSYARADITLRTAFISNLGDPSLDQVTHFWVDQETDFGSDWERVIKEKLQTSPIVLLIVTNSFLKSRYCMEVELPAAMECYKSGRARVVYVRLTEEPVVGTLLEELRPWPPRALELGSWNPVKELPALRIMLKKWVVEELKKRYLRGEPNLSFLHDEYGVPEPQTGRLTKLVTAACGIGSLFGWAVDSTIVPHLPVGLLGVMIVFSILDASAVFICMALRCVEMWSEKELNFGIGSTLAVSFAFVPIGLLRGAVYGLFAGLIFSPLSHGILGEWQSAAIGALLAAMQALTSLSQMCNKYLQIFLDVGDRTPGARSNGDIDEWPELENQVQESDTSASEAGSVEPQLLATAPSPLRAPTELQVAEAPSSPRTGPPMAPMARAFAVYTDRQKEWNERLTASGKANTGPAREEIALRTLTLHAPADSDDYEALLRAMTRVGVDDICIFKSVVCCGGEITESEYWSRTLSEFDVLIVLMSNAFVDCPVNHALSVALNLTGVRKPEIAPVVLEQIPVELSALMSFQAWPSAPVRSWPAQENAWVNVAIEMRNRFMREFRIRLQNYWLEYNTRIVGLRREKALAAIHAKIEETREKAQEQGELRELGANLREISEYLVMAKFEERWNTRLEQQRFRLPHFEELNQFPYRRYEWTFRIRHAVLWAVVTALAGVLAQAKYAHSIALDFSFTLVPALLLAALGFLREAKLRMYKPGRPFYSLIFDGHARGKKWTIQKSFLAAGVAATCGLATITFARRWFPGWPAWTMEALAGMMAYVLTSRRVPTVLMPKSAPTIGDKATYHFSLTKIIKSLLQSAALALMGLAIALLFSAGFQISLFWAMSLAAMLHEIALNWLECGWPRIRFRFLRNAWNGTLRTILYPAAQGWSYYIMFVGVTHFAGVQVPYFVFFLPALLHSFFRRLLYL
jgi:hypothetical protein